MKPRVIAVLGMTATGKSALALRLCDIFGGEIISADSMQVYRGMDIGTAKPSKAEMEAIPHHLIDILDIYDSFSAADFINLAKIKINEITARRKIPVIAGGTGLYTDMLFNSSALPEIDGGGEYREELYALAEKNGSQWLFEKLKKIDPRSAEKTHPNNIKRVARYLEIHHLTGLTPAEYAERSNQGAVNYETLTLCLTGDRQAAYERINKRVDIMLANGLVGEVETLWRRGLENTPTAGYAIGYRQFYPYFKGEESLETCVEKVKQHSRNYAKRQETYFKKMPARPVMADNTESAVKMVEEWLEG